MFDTVKIGRKISQLRKTKDMTQMELADAMGVSFQAVSNWERGNSMPDISRLGQLAQVLDTTVDQLLGQEAAAVNKVISEGKPELTAKEFARLAPALKPSQAEKAAENLGEFTLEDLGQMAPFLSEEGIDKLVRKLLQSYNGKLSEFASLAAFLPEETVGLLMEKAVAAGDLGTLAALGPFADEAELGRIARAGLQDGTFTLMDLVALAPFMDETDLDCIARRAAEMDADSLIAIAPFLDESDLDRIALKLAKEQGFRAIVPLMPWLSDAFADKL